MAGVLRKAAFPSPSAHIAFPPALTMTCMPFCAIRCSVCFARPLSPQEVSNLNQSMKIALIFCVPSLLIAIIFISSLESLNLQPLAPFFRFCTSALLTFAILHFCTRILEPLTPRPLFFLILCIFIISLESSAHRILSAVTSYLYCLTDISLHFI